MICPSVIPPVIGSRASLRTQGRRVVVVVVPLTFDATRHLWVKVSSTVDYRETASRWRKQTNERKKDNKKKHLGPGVCHVYCTQEVRRSCVVGSLPQRTRGDAAANSSTAISLSTVCAHGLRGLIGHFQLQLKAPTHPPSLPKCSS